MNPSILFVNLPLVRTEHVRLRQTRTVRTLSLILPVFFLAVGQYGCGTPSFSSSSGPPPTWMVVQATDLGAIPTNPDILGRDGGYSALFEDYSVWIYGDTFIAQPNAQDRTLLSDSWSYTTDLNAQSGLNGFHERLDSTGAPTMILPETAAEQAFNQAHNGNNCQAEPCGARWALWPSAIVVNPADNSAFIFYMVVSAQPGAFNFQGIGTSLATWQNFNQQPQRLSLNPPIVPDHPDLMFTENEPEFGTAAFASGGTLYVYGCGFATNSSDIGCRLGKVDLSSAQTRSNWTFYAGDGNWSSNVNDAVSVFTGGTGGMSVSWNSYLQSFVAVYSQPLSQNVMVRTSPNPEGPWSAETLAFVAMTPSSGNVYDAHAHSEYDLNGGETIFVSYSRATPAPFSSEVRLVAVEFESSHTP
jgi:hypothetical protein